MNQRRLMHIIISILLSFVAVACGSPSETADHGDAINESHQEVDDEGEIAGSQDAAGENNEAASGETMTLRMALLPVLDVLPALVAQENGYFIEEGLTVELVPVSSPIQREQVFEAGEVDGMLTDVIGVAIRNSAEPVVKIVAVSRWATEDSPLFRILAAPGNEVTAAGELAGVSIGISENSIIQYLGDRLLEQAGLAQAELVYQSVPDIATRFQLLMEGQLGAAILPDPLAQAAMEAGAVLVTDDTTVAEQEISQSVLVFRDAYLEHSEDAVNAFLRAWHHAVEDLNANPEDYRQLFLDNTNVPESIQETYVIPPFPAYEITSETVWDDVNAWLIGREIIEQAALYEDSVTGSFVETLNTN